MSDLISRKALIDYIKNWDIGWGVGHDQKTFINTIKKQPTVEAKPVVHGEWIKTRLAMEYQCSNCQNVVYAEYTRSGYKLFNFCPECGADMRKKVQDGKID